MKNKNFKSFIIFFLTIILCLFTLVPTVSGATKYNYVANGAKDILGFKISGITQVENGETIEISLTANKNVVEFSTYQDVEYNGVRYSTGNHTIEPCRSVKFIYTVGENSTLSPIIIYLTTIENTSCPLKISSYDANGQLLQETSLTLTATFFADEASDLRENQENSSGSLVQEDVIINRPKPVESTTVPTTSKPTKPSKPSTSQPTTEGTTKPVSPPNTSESTSDNTTEESTTIPEVQLPIVDDTVTQPSTEIIEDTTDEITTLPFEEDFSENTTNNTFEDGFEEETVPTTEENISENIFEFINNIDKKIIIIAIIVVFILLILVIVLIVSLSKNKNEKSNNEEVQLKKEKAPPKEKTPKKDKVSKKEKAPKQKKQGKSQNAQPPQVLPVQAPDNFVLDDDFLANSSKPTETKKPENVEFKEIQSPVCSPVTSPVITAEEKPVIIDKFEQKLLATIPENEIRELRKELEETGSLDDYNNII